MPDMLNFDVRPSKEKDRINKNFQYNNIKSERNLQDGDYNSPTHANTDNKNSSLQEKPFENLKLRNNVDMKENKNDYTKGLTDKKNINDYKDMDNDVKKSYNKNDHIYYENVAHTNNYYSGKEKSNNIVENDSPSQIPESQKPESEGKKMKIVSNKDPFSSSSVRFKEFEDMKKKHNEDHLKELNYFSNNNDSNYNANNKNDNQNLETFHIDNSKHKSIRRSESHVFSYSKTPISSSISPKLS
jgi:hypothetical protein